MKNKHTFILNRGHEDNDLFAPDGGVAVIRFNGEMMLTDYYEDRIKSTWDQEDIWENLAEGKMFCKEWPGKYELTAEMLDDAVEWLGFNPKEVIFEITDTR